MKSRVGRYIVIHLPALIDSESGYYGEILKMGNLFVHVLIIFQQVKLKVLPKFEWQNYHSPLYHFDTKN